MQFHSRHQPIPGCPSWWNTVHEGAGDLSLSLILLSPPQDSLYQTIPFRWKYCPISLISDLIQAWLLQFYPLWPSIIFTEPTTKSKIMLPDLSSTNENKTRLFPFWKKTTLASCRGPYPLQNWHTGFQALWKFSSSVPFRTASHLPTLSNSSVQQRKTVESPPN